MLCNHSWPIYLPHDKLFVCFINSPLNNSPINITLCYHLFASHFHTSYIIILPCSPTFSSYIIILPCSPTFSSFPYNKWHCYIKYVINPPSYLIIHQLSDHPFTSHFSPITSYIVISPLLPSHHPLTIYITLFSSSHTLLSIHFMYGTTKGTSYKFLIIMRCLRYMRHINTAANYYQQL